MTIELAVNAVQGLSLNVEVPFDPKVLRGITTRAQERIEAKEKLQEEVTSYVRATFVKAKEAANEGKTFVEVLNVPPTSRNTDRVKKGTVHWYVLNALKKVGFNAYLKTEKKEFSPSARAPFPNPIITCTIAVKW